MEFKEFINESDVSKAFSKIKLRFESEEVGGPRDRKIEIRALIGSKEIGYIRILKEDGSFSSVEGIFKESDVQDAAMKYFKGIK